MTRIFKIGNMTNARKYGRSSKRANWRDGKQDFSLPRLFHNLADFSLQPFQMVLDETQFLDEQCLFKQKTTLARKILCPNALGSKLLQQGQICFRGAISSPYFA